MLLLCFILISVDTEKCQHNNIHIDQCCQSTFLITNLAEMIQICLFLEIIRWKRLSFLINLKNLKQKPGNCAQQKLLFTQFFHFQPSVEITTVSFSTIHFDHSCPPINMLNKNNVSDLGQKKNLLHIPTRPEIIFCIIIALIQGKVIFIKRYLASNCQSSIPKSPMMLIAFRFLLFFFFNF